MTGRMDGEIAVVTGSTHGIGRATAIRFAAEGANVVVTGRDENAGAEVLARIAECGGGKATFVRSDLTDPAIGQSLAAAAVEAFGAPSVLVNNAASSDLVRNGVDRAVSEIDDEAWMHILNVNLGGLMRVTRAVLREMMPARRGSIVNISSRAARVGVPGIAGYTAVKGAIESLTRSIAVEYSEFGIRCNAIQVSFVQVLDERKGRQSLDADKDPRFTKLLLTRGGRPTDIANVALFLASSEAEFITGVVLPADGGASAVSGMPWASAKPPGLETAEGDMTWSASAG